MQDGRRTVRTVKMYISGLIIYLQDGQDGGRTEAGRVEDGQDGLKFKY